ncbi:hypothetical protein ACJX0J_025758, partial [Zea mays]
YGSIYIRKIVQYQACLNYIIIAINIKNKNTSKYIQIQIILHHMLLEQKYFTFKMEKCFTEMVPIQKGDKMIYNVKKWNQFRMHHFWEEDSSGKNTFHWMGYERRGIGIDWQSRDR